MWTRDALRTELFALFKSHSPAGADVTEASQITGDLELDSLAVMEVVAEIEDKFGLMIPDEMLPELRTVGDVAQGLEAMLSKDGKLS